MVVTRHCQFSGANEESSKRWVGGKWMRMMDSMDSNFVLGIWDDLGHQFQIEKSLPGARQTRNKLKRLVFPCEFNVSYPECGGKSKTIQNLFVKALIQELIYCHSFALYELAIQLWFPTTRSLEHIYIFMYSNLYASVGTDLNIYAYIYMYIYIYVYIYIYICIYICIYTYACIHMWHLCNYMMTVMCVWRRV